MSPGIFEALVDQHMAYAKAIGTSGAVWLLLSNSFCGYVISGFWNRRVRMATLLSGTELHWLCVVIFVLFLSLTAYPISVLYGVTQIEDQINALIKIYRPDLQASFRYGGIQVTMYIGTAVFVAVLLAWGALWSKLVQIAKKPVHSALGQ